MTEEGKSCVTDTCHSDRLHQDAQRESVDLNINIPDPHRREGVISLITSGHNDVGFLLTFEGKDLSHEFLYLILQPLPTFPLPLVRWGLVFSEATLLACRELRPFQFSRSHTES